MEYVIGMIMKGQKAENIIPLYLHTVIRMKPSQIICRCKRKLGLTCNIGVAAQKKYRETVPPAAFPELDFDTKFLCRFSADELLGNLVTFMHITEPFQWSEPWERANQTPLWNFNLHYFEYLFPLLNAYRETEYEPYLDKAFEVIRCWIQQNQESTGGNGWHPYTTSLRLTNWLGFLALAKDVIPKTLVEEMTESMHRQYVFLAKCLEKDLLGNHYFENLKALILCALFFHDGPMLNCAKNEFQKQCRAQFLADGMHFELSPMYHCLMLEGLLRVCISLRRAGDRDPELESYIPPAVNAAAAFGSGLERLPLFNDCGDNVAKSVPALLRTAERLHISPQKSNSFPKAGYYVFSWDEWTLFVDAGQPGAIYNGGHAHCDALSFELFCNGTPVIVNCGTWLYQCSERAFFRSTEAHNTVRMDGHEQSECWGVFRLARRSSVTVEAVGHKQIIMKLTDYTGATVTRTIRIDDQVLVISDSAPGHYLESWIHFNKKMFVCSEQNMEWCMMPYSPEYGVRTDIPVVKLSGNDQISCKLLLHTMNELTDNPA